MTNRQSIEIEMSEIREWLNEFSASVQRGDTFTDEEKETRETELTTKTNRLKELEPALRAAISAEEAATERIDRGEFDQETMELRELADRANLGEYMRGALVGRGEPSGAELELNQALKIQSSGQGIDIPMFMFAPPGEAPNPDGGDPIRMRADVATSLAMVKNQVHMGSYLRRVFRDKACMHLGVTMESAMIGERNHTVITSGTQGGTVRRGEGLDAQGVQMSVINMDPHRITARVIWETIDVARLPQLEAQIRHDTSMVFATAMEEEIWNGDSDNQLTTDGIKAGIPAAQTQALDEPHTATAQQIRTAIAGTLDGLYATSPMGVPIVVDQNYYNRWLNLGDADINQLTLETLKMQGFSVIGSLYVNEGNSAKPVKGQDFAVASKPNGRQYAYVIAVWPTMNAIIDHYTRAKEGQVILTLNGMWDQAMVRAANFRKFQVGTVA